MRMRNTSLLLLAGLTVGFAAHAGEPPAAGETTGTYNGVTVAIDPSTGRLRAPTAAELAELRANVPRANAMSLARPGPKTRAEAERTTVRHKDGHVSMQVSEDMMSNVIATQQADGSIRIEHADADGHAVPVSTQGGAVHE